MFLLLEDLEGLNYLHDQCVIRMALEGYVIAYGGCGIN